MLTYSDDLVPPRRTRPLVLAILVGLAALLGAAATAQTPSGADILHRALDLTAAVQDYTAQVSVVTDLKAAPPTVPPFKVYFKRPDKVHIESRSVVVMRRDMLTFGNLAQRLEEGTEVNLLGSKTVDGVLLYTLKLIPKHETQGPPKRLLVTVNGTRWTVEQMVMYSGDKQAAIINWSYAWVGNRYWMPVWIQCTVPSAPKQDGSLGGQLTVTFSDYHINTGLSDSLFTQPSAGGR